jgi:hypothetical protein
MKRALSLGAASALLMLSQLAMPAAASPQGVVLAVDTARPAQSSLLEEVRHRRWHRPYRWHRPRCRVIRDCWENRWGERRCRVERICRRGWY